MPSFNLGKQGSFRDNSDVTLSHDPGPDRAHTRTQLTPLVSRYMADTEAGLAARGAVLVIQEEPIDLGDSKNTHANKYALENKTNTIFRTLHIFYRGTYFL